VRPSVVPSMVMMQSQPHQSPEVSISHRFINDNFRVFFSGSPSCPQPQFEPVPCANSQDVALPQQDLPSRSSPLQSRSPSAGAPSDFSLKGLFPSAGASFRSFFSRSSSSQQESLLGVSSSLGRSSFQSPPQQVLQEPPSSSRSFSSEESLFRSYLGEY